METSAIGADGGGGGISMAEAGAAPPSAAAYAEGREVRDLRSEESWRGGVERESESGTESARVCV